MVCPEALDEIVPKNWSVYCAAVGVLVVVFDLEYSYRLVNERL